MGINRHKRHFRKKIYNLRGIYVKQGIYTHYLHLDTFMLMVKKERTTQNKLHISFSRYISKKGKMAKDKDHRLEGDFGL